ncbi:MAG: hypothetical protein Q4A18_05820 [Rikenellaceae bacterium]|nr:hypothetical protein [Rikenellaceae bacterium]
MEENKYWQRLSAVIRWANMSANYFALHIGLARGENLYQIKRGNNGISLNLAERIVQHFPEVSKLWLLTGEGDMLLTGSVAASMADVPFYRVDVEASIRDVANLEPDCSVYLPLGEKYDLAMLYLGGAMGRIVPAGTIVFLRKVELDALIPGKEYVVVGPKIVALRTVRRTSNREELRLVAGDKKNYDEMTFRRDEVEALYAVGAKLTINN